MATVLIVEDDKNTQLLTAALLKPRFDVICAGDGQDALEVMYKTHIDLIVADIMMPRMDGYTFVKTLREGNIDTPVLLLTARRTIEDKREGFYSGTDDYMTKPVNYEELLWRIDALLRRAKIASERKITIGTMIIDSATYSVNADGKSTVLPKKEFELLYKLLSYPGIIFTRNQLLDEIWGFDSESGEDTIKTHINRLRKRFSDCTEFEIITIKGLGYKAELGKKD